MTTTDKMLFLGLISLVLCKQHLATEKRVDMALGVAWGLLACGAMVGVIVELIA